MKRNTYDYVGIGYNWYAYINLIYKVFKLNICRYVIIFYEQSFGNECNPIQFVVGIPVIT